MSISLTMTKSLSMPIFHILDMDKDTVMSSFLRSYSCLHVLALGYVHVFVHIHVLVLVIYKHCLTLFSHLKPDIGKSCLTTVTHPKIDLDKRCFTLLTHSKTDLVRNCYEQTTYSISALPLYFTKTLLQKHRKDVTHRNSFCFPNICIASIFDLPLQLSSLYKFSLAHRVGTLP